MTNNFAIRPEVCAFCKDIRGEVCRAGDLREVRRQLFRRQRDGLIGNLLALLVQLQQFEGIRVMVAFHDLGDAKLRALARMNSANASGRSRPPRRSQGAVNGQRKPHETGPESV